MDQEIKLFDGLINNSRSYWIVSNSKFVSGFYCWDWEFLTALLLFIRNTGRCRDCNYGIMVKMMISNGGGGNSRCVPAPFLTKTYQLVEDPSTDDVISWSEKGNTFVVWKSAEFARDLLPKYFKHNNFSSFVRQLNTYGFRKIVPDKWEFQNEGFKQGEKELLCEINRRKSVHASTVRIIPNGKGSGPSHSNSGDEMGTSSMSDTKNNASDETTEITTMNATQMSNLPDENEKLRKDNQLLTSELARTKKQCEDLTVFLSKYINVAPVQINHVMLHGGVGGLGPKPILENKVPHIDDGDDDDDENENEGECLKLFGVMLKGKKRGRDEGNCGLPSVKEMKVMDYRTPWMKISSSQGGSSKICN